MDWQHPPMEQGFFGTIDTDSGEFHGYPFVPSPRGAALIWSLRQMQASQPFEAGNTIVLGDDFEQSGVSMEDVGILHLLGGLAVFDPNQRFIAATAVALLLNSAYFYIEAAARPEHCEVMLHPLNASSVQEAHQRFMQGLWDRYRLT